MEPNNNMYNAPKENSLGPIIATVAILVILIIGGLYFWGKRSASTNEAAPAANVQAQGSTNSAALENDLNNVHTDNLDTQLNGS